MLLKGRGCCILKLKTLVMQSRIISPSVLGRGLEEHREKVSLSRGMGEHTLGGQLGWGFPQAGDSMKFNKPVLGGFGGFFLVVCLASCAVCRILFPGPGIKLGPAVRVPSPNHWTTREVPI